jgi:Na+/melibiose symporter-like transporter
VNTDLVLWISVTLVGTCVGLLHVALTIRALRRSWLGGIASLVVPLAAPVVAYRTGGRKAAITYGVFVAAYLVLLALST